MTTVVINGFGPHIRFKSAQTDQSGKSGLVRVVTNTSIKSVRLSNETDLTFHQAA